MDITQVLKFDASPFSDVQLAAMQGLADRCEAASLPAEIEEAGGELDAWRQRNREATRLFASQQKSRNALFKALLHEVPRRFLKAKANDEEVG